MDFIFFLLSIPDKAYSAQNRITYDTYDRSLSQMCKVKRHKLIKPVLAIVGLYVGLVIFEYLFILYILFISIYSFFPIGFFFLVRIIIQNTQKEDGRNERNQI